MRLTIVSTDENAPLDGNGEVITGNEHALDSIRDMFVALRACWVLPSKDDARHGMEYTIRFAFKRDGMMIATPRMTYSSHDAPGTTRDIYRVAIDAAEALHPITLQRRDGGSSSRTPDRHSVCG